MSNSNLKYWTAFYTKPRNEKKVAERLSGQGYNVYCPIRTVVKQWSDRKKKVKEPVFTSYIFAHVDELERQEILRDQGVASSVFWLKKPVIIKETEIQAIKDFLNDFSSAKEMDISNGDMAIITSGPLKGEEGIVRHLRGNKVLLHLKGLGLGLQAEIAIGKLNLVR